MAPCVADVVALGVVVALVASREAAVAVEVDSVPPVVAVVAAVVVSAVVAAAVVSAAAAAVVLAVVVVVASAGVADRFHDWIFRFARLLVSMSPRKNFPRGQTNIVPLSG